MNCPACGSEIRKGRDFCLCGWKRQKEAAPPPDDSQVRRYLQQHPDVDALYTAVYAGAIARPDWWRREDESSRDYALRMSAECRRLSGGAVKRVPQ